MASQIAMTLGALSTANRIILICGIGSAALLIGAFLFEYVGGLAPCKMCIWQRWAHGAVIAMSIFGVTAMPRKIVLALIAGAAAISALIAGYHAGVEWQLWEGPSGCTAALSSNLSAAALVDDLLATAVIRCDEVAWSLFGLSMAGWNMLLSAAIAGMALLGMANHMASTAPIGTTDEDKQ